MADGNAPEVVVDDFEEVDEATELRRLVQSPASIYLHGRACLRLNDVGNELEPLDRLVVFVGTAELHGC